MSLVICTCIALVHKHFYLTMPFSLCIPVFDPSKSQSLNEWITIFLLALIFLSSAVVTFNHILLVNNMQRSKKSAGKSASDGKDVLLKTQLALLSVCHTIVWATFGGIFLYAMITPVFSLSLIFFTFIPLSSIIEQIIFIVLCVKKLLSGSSKVITI